MSFPALDELRVRMCYLASTRVPLWSNRAEQMDFAQWDQFEDVAAEAELKQWRAKLRGCQVCLQDVPNDRLSVAVVTQGIPDVFQVVCTRLEDSATMSTTCAPNKLAVPRCCDQCCPLVSSVVTGFVRPPSVTASQLASAHAQLPLDLLSLIAAYADCHATE